MSTAEKGVVGGELLFCGTTAWDTIGRRKVPESSLVSPTRLRSLIGVDICYVASGCASCHCIALDVNGRCYTWGRNDKGQLGHGDQVQRDMPTVVSALASYKIVKASSGKSHTVVVTEDGLSLAFGWNKHGQLGSGSVRNEIELYPVRCQVADVTNVACGADFTVWLTSVEGASILTAGLPQYGQLGHGTDNEYNTKDSSVKLAYEAQPRPKAIAAFANETIVKVACGSNHTVAVDSKGFVYTWGYGGYGRLGHREQKDEFSPRRVDLFTKHNLVPPGAVVSAGSANSAVTAAGGQMYMWGKIKSTGDDSMYPKPLMDLSGWHIRCMDSGSMHHFVGADSSCISWGHAQSGELGYGPHQQKSSAIPKKVDTLEGMHVISVACGLAHSLVVVDRTNVADQLEQLEIYDGKPAGEGVEEPSIEPPSVKQTNKKAAAKTTNKRKKKSAASGEPSSSSLPSLSSSERTVIITLSSPSPLSPPIYPLSSTTVSTTTVWNQWTVPSYLRPSPSPEEPIIDYEEPVPRTPRPMPPPLPIPPRPYPPTKLRLPTRPTGTPPIINVPLPEMPTSMIEEKSKVKPTLITHKSSADTTAMIIGLIAIVLIVIVIVTPLFLFLKVRYRSGPAYKTESTSKNFRFLPVATGAPTLLTSASQSTHLGGPLLEGSTVVHKGTKVTASGKKKDGMEWYV